MQDLCPHCRTPLPSGEPGEPLHCAICGLKEVKTVFIKIQVIGAPGLMSNGSASIWALPAQPVPKIFQDAFSDGELSL
jgi:hypothetical protein